MGQTQHKYAAVHLYNEGLGGCTAEAPSVAYLLPGSYCDNADNFGRDQTKLVGGLFYQQRDEWWADPPYSDTGLGKLPYQGSALAGAAEDDTCGGFAFDCPELALYSNQSVCNYSSICPPPPASPCAGRTLGNAANAAARPAALLASVQYFRIECEFDPRGSLLFRELDSASCDGFDAEFGDGRGVPGVAQGQNYAGWWALPGVLSDRLGKAKCVDTTAESTFVQRWVLEESVDSGGTATQEVDVEFFADADACAAFDPASSEGAAAQGAQDFGNVRTALASTPWDILLTSVLHANIFSGSNCMVPIAGSSACAYDSTPPEVDLAAAFAACTADLDCPGVIRVPPPDAGNADDAEDTYHLCTAAPESDADAETVTWRRVCRSPPWRTGCTQADHPSTPYPIGMAALTAEDTAWIGWVWFLGVVGVLLLAYFLWRLFCWKPCKKCHDDIVAEGSKRRVKPWAFVEAPLEPSERRKTTSDDNDDDDSDDAVDVERPAVSVAFEDLKPRAWLLPSSAAESRSDVYLRKYCFRAGPIGIHFHPFVDPSDVDAHAAAVAAVGTADDDDPAVVAAAERELTNRGGGPGGPVGVRVGRLEPGGRAEEVGVPPGALVVSLNGRDVTHLQLPAFNALLAGLTPNRSGVFATLHVRVVDPARQRREDWRLQKQRQSQIQQQEQRQQGGGGEAKHSGTDSKREDERGETSTRARSRSRSRDGDVDSEAGARRRPGKSPAMAEKEAATGWFPAVDAVGRTFFARPAVTPADPEVDKPIAALQSWHNPWIDQWHETVDDTGNVYYFNGLLQEASWYKPAGFVDLEAEEKARVARVRLLKTKLKALDAYDEDGVDGFSKEELAAERTAIGAELAAIDVDPDPTPEQALGGDGSATEAPVARVGGGASK